MSITEKVRWVAQAIIFQILTVSPCYVALLYPMNFSSRCNVSHVLSKMELQIMDMMCKAGPGNC